MIRTGSLRGFGSFAYLPYTYPRYRPMLLSASGKGPVTAVEGTVDGQPAGLALAADVPEHEAAVICSLYVAPPYRRLGLGKRMLEHIERDLRERGLRTLSIGYVTGWDTTAAFERILSRLGWSASAPYFLLVHCDCRMLGSEWMSLSTRLPDDYEIFLWSGLRAEERRALLASQASDPWIPQDLDPFQIEQFHAFNSLGLRYRGAVVGWVLTEEFDEQTLSYACSYIRPDLKRRGRLVQLWVEAVRRHALELAKYPKAAWRVICSEPDMARFIRHRMGPYADYLEEFRTSSKALHSALEPNVFADDRDEGISGFRRIAGRLGQ